MTPEGTPSREELLATLEYYQRQLDSLSRQINFLEGVVGETTRARRTLSAFEEETQEEILVPLGASTFVRGRVSREDVVITGIGAGYATERSRQEAMDLLEKREQQLRTDLERLMQTAVQVQSEASSLQDALESDDPSAPDRA